MEDINEKNVLEYWRTATVEEQRANIDRVIEIIGSSNVNVPRIWQLTKDEIKCERPDLVIKFLEVVPFQNYVTHVWIWHYTPEYVKEQQKEEVKELLKDNEAALVHMGLKEQEVKTMNEILKDLEEHSFLEVMQKDYITDEFVKSAVSEFIKKLENGEETYEDESNIINLVIQHILGKIPNCLVGDFLFKVAANNKNEWILKEFIKNIDKEILLNEMRTMTPGIAEIIKDIVSTKTTIGLVIKNASELSIEQIEILSQKFDIETIQMEDENIEFHQEIPYSLEQYKKCRGVIKSLLEGIDFSPNLNDPNREKIIFGKVIKRLANHICYDYESYEKKENDEKVFESANMVGGLLNSTCVCSGYAEIVRNVFACCGIEARYISGDKVDQKERGHAWNQIKLDGEWYNMDLTWDQDRIVKGEPTKFLLKSDWDFLEHAQYDTSKCKKERCIITVPSKDLQRYLQEGEKNLTAFDESISSVASGEIEEAYEIIASSRQKNPNSEKGGEEWID